MTDVAGKIARLYFGHGLLFTRTESVASRNLDRHFYSRRIGTSSGN